MIQLDQEGPPDPHPQPPPVYDRLFHTWAVDLYVYTIYVIAAILLPLYTFVLVKVCKGTKYPFIIFLIVLLIASNIS